MRGPEEWPSRGSNPVDKIRLTDPAAKLLLFKSICGNLSGNEFAALRTGYQAGFSWIDLPIFGEDGRPIHERGVVSNVPGMYFVGLHFLYAMSSVGDRRREGREVRGEGDRLAKQYPKTRKRFAGRISGSMKASAGSKRIESPLEFAHFGLEPGGIQAGGA